MSRFVFALALLLAACDDAPPPDDPLVFQGVAVEADGDATLALSGGELVASGLAGSRSGGVRLARVPRRLDVQTAPLAVPAGGRFGVALTDAAGQPVAHFYNDRPAGASASVLRFSLPTGTTRARIVYRRAGREVFTIPTLSLGGTGGRRAAESSAGSAEGESGSVHVIRNSDGRYVLVSDSGTSERAAAGACVGFTIVPPVALPTDLFPTGTLCADWVEVEPLDGPAVEAKSVVVSARGVGSFRVRSLVAAG